MHTVTPPWASLVAPVYNFRIETAGPEAQERRD